MKTNFGFRMLSAVYKLVGQLGVCFHLLSEVVGRMRLGALILLQSGVGSKCSALLWIRAEQLCKWASCSSYWSEVTGGKPYLGILL